MLILLTILAVLLLIRQLSTVAMIWKANGIEVLPHFIVLVLLILFASCSKDDSIPQVCYDGTCDARLEIPGELDDNGYYHIDLEWNGQYYPRFSIDTYADATDSYWWYNDQPVVQANFYTDTTWKFQNDVLPIVQQNRIYLSSKDKSNILYGKRIVGPFPPEMQGDTIQINAVIFWDAGINYKEKEISIKFIVE